MSAGRAASLVARGLVLAAAAAVAVGGPAAAARPAGPVVPAVTAGCPEPNFWEQLFNLPDDCDAPTVTPAPTPAPTDDPGGLLPELPELPALPGLGAGTGGAVPGEPAPVPLPDAPADEGAPVFTADPATLSSDGLQIEGLHGLAIVTVPLADGTSQRAIRIEADRIVIPGFQLDVPAGEGGLRNTATTLTIEGNVVVYTPSISGILADGTERLIDTLSNPTPEAIAALTRLTLPLTGMLADDIRYDDSHQATF